MVLDQVANFIRGEAAEAIDSTETTIDVVDASVFPDPTNGEYNVVIWNVDTYARPDLDPDVEILRVTSSDTGVDTLTVTRGQEGTTGVSHPNGSAIHLTPTAKMFTDVEANYTAQGEDFDGQSTSDFTDLQTVSTSSLTESGFTNAVIIDAYRINSPEVWNTFSVASQDTAPRGVWFTSNGEKMFIAGAFSDSIYGYTLFDNFDVSSASLDSSYDSSSEVATIDGVVLSPDGNQMYAVDSNTGDVTEYSLASPFDVSTATVSTTFDVTSEDTNPTDIRFNSDGSNMFLTGSSNDNVYEYTLTTPYDISTASFDSSFDVSSQSGDPTGLDFSESGDFLFVVDSTTDELYKYNLSTAYDVSTAGFIDSFSLNNSNSHGVFWDPDGTRFFVIDLGNDIVRSYGGTALFGSAF